MNRAEKIEILELIKAGKLNAEWLNVQCIVEQPDGSLTCNGKPYNYDPESEPNYDVSFKKIYDKYINYDLSGVSIETLKKWSENNKKKK